MELAAAAFASLSSALAPAAATTAAGIGADVVASGAAASATAATAGGGLLSSLGSASLFSSILQGGLGLVGAMGALRQGQAQADQYAQQATTTDLDAKQTEIAGLTSQTNLKSQLVATLGQRDVAYGASGVDLSFGTPAQARSQAMRDAGAALTADASGTAASAGLTRARAAGYRRLAADAVDAGQVNAAGDVLNAGARILMRG